MLGSALYYPRIDVTDPVWLRSAVLFWDDVRTIVPAEISEPYQTQDSRICWEAGFLKPLLIEDGDPDVQGLGKKIVSLGNRKSALRDAIRRSANPHINSLSLADSLTTDVEATYLDSNMYYMKMSSEARELAIKLGLAKFRDEGVPDRFRDDLIDFDNSSMTGRKDGVARTELELAVADIPNRDHQWLLVNSHFSKAYMAALASAKSKRQNLSCLTSNDTAHALAFRFLFDQHTGTSDLTSKGILLSVVMRGIRIDASVPIENVLKFRASRRDQFLELEAELAKLTSKIEEVASENLWEVQKQARHVYATEVEPKLRSLKRELELNSIGALWEGAYRAATITAPSATALNYFLGSSSTLLFGAGAAIAVVDIGVRTNLAKKKIRNSNPYAYLYDATNSFGLPEF